MAFTSDTSLELRVLAGQLKGASIPLSQGKDIRIGHQLRNDVVLRDPDWKNTRLKMTCDNHAATVEVLTGEVELLGQKIEAPNTVTVPSFVPLCIGETAIAFGEHEDATWDKCTKLIPFAASEVELENDVSETDAVEGSDKPISLMQTISAHINRRTMGVVAGATAFCLLAVAGSIALNGKTSTNPILMASQVIADTGFDRVTVQENGAGSLIVAGYVETDADLAVLAQKLDQANVRAEYSVKSGDAIQTRIIQLAAMSDINVTVRNLEDQRFEVSGIMTREQAQALRGELNTEISGIENLLIKIDALPEPPLPEVRNRRGDEILQVKRFPSDGGVIITRDGSRIMQGGMLPNGFKVVKFGADGIHLERAGKRVVQAYPQSF